MDLVLEGTRQALSNNAHTLDIYTFGKESGHNWNIAPLRDPEEVLDKNALLLAETIGSLADLYGVRAVSAPRPTLANGVVIEERDFTIETSLPRVKTTLLQGVNADGVVFGATINHLNKSAFWISSADCPTLIALGENGCWGATHCARNSIITTNQGSGISSVTSLINSLVYLGEDVSKIVVIVCLGIHSEKFEHKWSHQKWGDRNKEMTSYVMSTWGEDCVVGDVTLGKLDLFKIISSQLKSSGIISEKISRDTTDTFSDKIDGDYKWWSFRRGDTGRNGIFITPAKL